MLGRRSFLALTAIAATTTLMPAVAASSLQRHGDYLFLAVEVNGTPLLALLDSAAEMTMLDPETAARLGLFGKQGAQLRGSGAGTIETRMVKGVHIAAAGAMLPPTDVIVADLGDISCRLTGMPVAMILGREFFDAHMLAIDIAAGKLAIVPRGAHRRGRRLPLTTQFGVETVPIRIDGVPAQATFDLGNGSRMMVSRAFADRAGLLAPDRMAGSVTGGGLGGATRLPLVRLHSVEVAGIGVPVAEAAVEASDHASDANIGVGVLRHFRIVCDYAGRALWFDPVRQAGPQR